MLYTLGYDTEYNHLCRLKSLAEKFGYSSFVQLNQDLGKVHNVLKSQMERKKLWKPV